MDQSNKNKLYDIFISHSSKDAKLVIALCHYLETRGLRCWMAPRDIQAGSDYGDALVKAIRASKIMVVVFTASSNTSKAVRHEVERAFHHQLVIIPFRTQDIIPEESFEFFLSATHWLDAIDGNAEDYFEALYLNCASILNIEAKHNPAGGTAVKQKESSSKSLVVYVIAAIAVAAVSFGIHSAITHYNKPGDTAAIKKIDTPAGKIAKENNPNGKVRPVTQAPDIAQATIPTTTNAVKKSTAHEKLPAEIESSLNGVTYEQSSSNDKLLFTINGIGKVHFSGSAGGYDITGDMVLEHGTSFKIISGNATGSITLAGVNQIKGALVIKRSNMSCDLDLKRVNE